MASSINASTSGVGGVITTADASGVLDLQTADVTRAYVSASGLTVNRINSASEGGQLDLCRSSDNTSAWAVDVYGSTSTPSLRFVDNVASATRMAIDGSGNILVANNSSANLTNFTTQALTTASQSGYVKLPNGLILQWGRVSFSGTSASVTFPIAFPTAFWGLAGIPKYGSGISIAFNGESTSGLTLRTSVNTGDYFPYIAYGY